MKKRGRLKKGLAMLLSAAMIVGLMPGIGTIRVFAEEYEEIDENWKENAWILNNTTEIFENNVYIGNKCDVFDGNPDTDQVLNYIAGGRGAERFLQVFFQKAFKEGTAYTGDWAIDMANTGSLKANVAGFSITTSSKTTQYGEKCLPNRLEAQTYRKDNDYITHKFDETDLPYAGGITTSFLFDEPYECVYFIIFFKEASSNEICIGDIDVLLPCSHDHKNESAEGHLDGFEYEGEVKYNCKRVGYKVEKCEECGYARRYDIVSNGGHEPGENGECKGCHYVFERPECVDGVYQIENEGQFNWFAALVNGELPQEEDNGNTNINAALTSDIVLTKRLDNDKKCNIKYVGSKDIEYNGTFDGQNHAIENVVMETDENDWNGGLFWNVGIEGEIKNLKLIDGDFNLKNGYAALCGKNAGNITNCSLESNSYNKIHGEKDFAGICGLNKQTGNIELCYTDIAITTDDFTWKDGNADMVNKNVAGICYDNYGIIQKCHNEGKILSAGYGAGICYINEPGGEIKYCYNDGTIGDDDIKCDYMSGICGSNAGLVYSCYNSGIIRSSKKYTGNLYGICRNVGRNVDGENYLCFYRNKAEADWPRVDNYYSSILDGYSNGMITSMSLTKDEMFSGKMVYLLNGSKSDDTVVWRQKLPARVIGFDNSRNDNIVYTDTPCGTSYSNVKPDRQRVHTFTTISNDWKSHKCSECGEIEYHSDVAEISLPSEQVIKASCYACGDIGGVKICQPVNLCYDGREKPALLKNISRDSKGNVINGIMGYMPEITYQIKKYDGTYEDIDTIPRTVGTYKATATYTDNNGKDYSASVEYEIYGRTPTLGTVSSQGLQNTLDEKKVVLSRSDTSVDGVLELKEGTKLQYGTHYYDYVFIPSDRVNYQQAEGKVRITVSDTIAPKATVRVNTKLWESLFKSVNNPFFTFVKGTKRDSNGELSEYKPEIEITASDNTGIDGIYYYISDCIMSEDALKALSDADWQVYDNTVKPSLSTGKHFVYAKVTDGSGNTAYVGTDGIVIYRDSAAASTDISYTLFENHDKTAQVTLNGNTIEKIKDSSGNTLTRDSDYTVEEDGTITIKASYLETLAVSDNPYRLTVSVKPLDETYVISPDDDNSLNNSPENISINIRVGKAEGSVTDISDLSKTFDGKMVGVPDFTTTNIKSDSTVIVEYKLADSDDAAYTKMAPKDVGTYKVRVTVDEDEKYGEITAERTFTIWPKNIESAEVTLGPSLTYIGLEQRQKVMRVVIDGEILDSSDYEVSRATAVDAGTYTLDIAGKGNYMGTAVKEFVVAKKKAPVIPEVSREYNNMGTSGESVTINIDELLPEDRGTTTYSVDCKYDKLVEKLNISDDGKLSYSIGKWNCERVFDISVTAASNNYENITVNVKIIINGLEEVEESEEYKAAIVESDELAYGQRYTEVIPKLRIVAPSKGKKLTDTKNKAVFTVTKPGRVTVSSDTGKYTITSGEVAYTKSTNAGATTLTIPSTVKIDGITYRVTSIGAHAFANNKRLTCVTIGSKVKTMGSRAFYKCTKLKKVKIGKGVTAIGVNAFYGCKNLKTITIETTKLSGSKVGSRAFAGIHTRAVVKVPKNRYEAYRKLLKAKGLGAEASVKK